MFASQLHTHHWPIQDSIHSHASLAHVLIRCRLRSGREHVRNKQYALNSRVRLITRVYGTTVHDYERVSDCSG